MAKRALFTRDSYIEVAVSGDPLYVEYDVEWTPDQFYGGWYPQGSSGFASFVRTAGDNMNSVAVNTEVGWTDNMTLYNTVSLTPHDGRGKHHIKHSLVSNVWKVTIDGVLVETYTWGAVFAIDRIRFGLTETGWRTATPAEAETVYLDNLQVGSTDGGTEYMSLNFDDGTFGSFTPVGTVTIVDDAIPNEDDANIYFDLVPYFDTPFTRRALIQPVDPHIVGDLTYVEEFMSLPVGIGDGPIYGSCQTSWLYTHSIAWDSNDVLAVVLLDISNNIIDGLYISPDDESPWLFYPWSSGWDNRIAVPTVANWYPSGGKAQIEFRYEDNQVEWIVDGISTGVVDTEAGGSAGDLNKIRFGWNETVGSFSERTGATALFIDNIKIGTTTTGDIAVVDFEDGTSGELTEAGQVYYPDTVVRLPEFWISESSTTTNDGEYINIGPLSGKNDPATQFTTEQVYIEFDLAWTTAQQTAWDAYSGYFVFLTNHDQDWVEYLYYDEGWWDNSDLHVPLTGDQSGTHHIKMAVDQDNSHIWIDGSDTGDHPLSGSPIGSIKFGSVFRSFTGESGCTITNIKIGTTDGGVEIYG